MALPDTNKEMIRRGMSLIIEGLGYDPLSEAFRDTPSRVAKLYSEILDYRYSTPGKITVFEEPDHDNSSVMVVGVPFYSFCAHHMLPFFGTFGAAYIPGKKLLGLSKIVRLVRHPAKKPTTQEELTKEAVECLVKYAEPRGAMVWMRAEHMCMTLRGVKSPGSSTITTAFRGEYESNPELREIFLQECRSA